MASIACTGFLILVQGVSAAKGSEAILNAGETTQVPESRNTTIGSPDGLRLHLSSTHESVGKFDVYINTKRTWRTKEGPLNYPAAMLFHKENRIVHGTAQVAHGGLWVLFQSEDKNTFFDTDTNFLRIPGVFRATYTLKENQQLLKWHRDFQDPSAENSFDVREYCGIQASRRSIGNPLLQESETFSCIGQILTMATDLKLKPWKAAAELQNRLLRCAQELGGMTYSQAEVHYEKLGWYGMCD